MKIIFNQNILKILFISAFCSILMVADAGVSCVQCSSYELCEGKFIEYTSVELNDFSIIVPQNQENFKFIQDLYNFNFTYLIFIPPEA